MNFSIFYKIILTYILNRILGVIDCNNNTVTSSDTTDSEDPYCQCEFSNPDFIFGKSIDPAFMMKMCEMTVVGHANVAQYYKFTAAGSRVCGSVCKKCVNSIKEHNEPKRLQITVLENYCEMVDKNKQTITNLATQCVCVYRIQCDGWQTVVVYKLHANSDGMVKVESN